MPFWGYLIKKAEIFMGYAKQGKELKKSAFQNRVGKITMQSFKNPKFMIFLSSNKLSQFLQKLAEYNQKFMLMPFFQLYQ